MKPRLISVLALAASLALSAPAAAEPGLDIPLRFIAATEDIAYFLALEPPVRDGSVVEVWELAVRVRPVRSRSSGQMIAGGWQHSRIDCAAETLTVIHSTLINTDLETVYRYDQPLPTLHQPSRQSEAGLLIAHLCRGAELPEPKDFQGVAGAVRHGQGAGMTQA